MKVEANSQETAFSQEIGERETRKLRLRARGVQSAWSGFGMFGLIGWSVAVPTLAGAFIGQELDKRYAGAHSWTLTLLIVGMAMGAFNAWAWLRRQEAKLDD